MPEKNRLKAPPDIITLYSDPESIIYPNKYTGDAYIGIYNLCPKGCSILTDFSSICNPCTYFVVGDVVKDIQYKGLYRVIKVGKTGTKFFNRLKVETFGEVFRKISETFASCTVKYQDGNNIEWYVNGKND